MDSKEQELAAIDHMEPDRGPIEKSVTKISWTPGFSREVPPLKRGIRPSSQLILVRPS